MNRNLIRLALTVSFGVFCALIGATAFAKDAPTERGTNPSSHDDLSGIWLLDLEASDPIAPMLEAMGAPWIVRKMAPMMTPTMTITALPHGGVRVVNENPIQTTRQEIYVDDTLREREDPLGRRVISKASWNQDGDLVVSQKNFVDDDRSVQITSTWTREGDELSITNRIDAQDKPQTVRRIFRPQR